MFLGMHKHGRLHKAMIAMRMLTAFCVFVLTILQGMTLCLCPSVQEDCDNPAHECAGMCGNDSSTFAGHNCEHIDIAELPPVRTVPNPLDELLVTLLVVADFRNPVFDLKTPDLLSHVYEHPPNVQPAHLIYIARSVQILC